MATVYLGRIVGRGGFQRLVAIKKMHPHLAQNADFVSMFLDEARLAASIHHPNVVGTLDIDEASDGLALVMEFIDGTSLFKLYSTARKEGARVPLPIVIRIMIDALAGLQAAHDLTNSDGQPLNLVHRDISPQNILVGVDGISRITDFGVARAEERLVETSDGSMKGKLAYMCPEQIRGDVLDRRADVYAAGVVFWELLAGRRLFSAESGAATVAKVLKGATEPPSVHSPEVPPAIDVVAMTSLLDGSSRYASAVEFAEALERAAQSSGIPIATARQVGEHVKTISPPVVVNSGSISIVQAPPPSMTGPQAPPPSGPLPHGAYVTGPFPHGTAAMPPIAPDGTGTGSGAHSGVSGVSHAIPSLTAMNPMLQPGAPHPRPGPTTMQGVVGGVAFALALCVMGTGGLLYVKSQKKDPEPTTSLADAPPPVSTDLPPASTEPTPTPPTPTGVAVTPTAAPPPASAEPPKPKPTGPVVRPQGPSHSPPAPAPPAPAPGKPGGKFHPLDP